MIEEELTNQSDLQIEPIRVSADQCTSTERLADPQTYYDVGHAFAAEKLSSIFPRLKEHVAAVMAEKQLQPEDVAFIFLDRDARPSLHAWQQYTDHQFKSIPLAVSRVQFPGYSTEFSSYYWNYINGTSFTYSELETEINERPITWYLQAQEVNGSTEYKEWLAALSAILTKSLAGKKHVFIIDTGYMGSMVYFTKFIVDRMVENSNGRTSEMKMLFGSHSVSAAPFILEGSSVDHEHTIPHDISGYTLDPESKTMRYERDSARSTLARAFTRGCADYFKEKSISKKI